MDSNANQQGTQSLTRVFAVLDAVREGKTDLATIGAYVGTGKSTTHRIASFLQRNGYLRYLEGRGYLLGPRLIELGAAALDQMPLTACARPHLEQLSRDTGDSIHLSVRDGDSVVYVDKISGTKGLEMRSRIGLKKPVATTGTGKVQMFDMDEEEWRRLYKLAKADAMSLAVEPAGFLAWETFKQRLQQYRQQDYAIEREENELGICCVAAPIRDSAGRIIAGLSVASSVHYMPDDRMQELIQPVKECAVRISKELGYVAPV